MHATSSSTLRYGASIPRELVASVLSIEDPLQTVYSIANFQRMDLDEAQKLLEMDSALRNCINWLACWRARSKYWKWGRRSRTRLALRLIKSSVSIICGAAQGYPTRAGRGDEQTAEIEEFREKIEAAGMPEEAESKPP